MATEKANHKAALALAQKRLSYLSADVNARLLFVAQPAAHGHGAAAGVAFAALMLPTLSGGVPSHWLSNESVESLRRWCDEEGMPLSALRCVIGRVVHVAGPFEAPGGRAAAAGAASSGAPPAAAAAATARAADGGDKDGEAGGKGGVEVA